LSGPDPDFQHPVVPTYKKFGHGHGKPDDPAAWDAAYIKELENPDIDGWQVRQIMNDMHSEDMVPEPAIIIAAMKACRKINDYAIAVRYLEAVKEKCGPNVKEIWPYLMNEVQPTLTELGISNLEEMGYDKPELAAENVEDMH